MAKLARLGPKPPDEASQAVKKRYSERVSEAVALVFAQELRERVADIAAVTEKYHLDKQMLGWVRQLLRMSPEKLADKLAHFEYLCDISGLTDRAKSAQRLGLGDEGGATVHTLRAAE